MSPLARFAPGLAQLFQYKLADLPADIRAGLAVAAVALPVGIAYAELAGFPPVVGLYSSILPLLAYAIFGTSRQLIVGPDAATCAVIAAAITPLAAGDAATYASLSAMLALLTGLICIAASFLRLGALADFLSRPILVGFLNGIALSIILGQADKIFGFPVLEGGIFPRLAEIVGKLGEIHGPTFVVAAGTFVVVAIAPRLLPSLPAALVGMTLAGAAVYLSNVHGHKMRLPRRPTMPERKRTKTDLRQTIRDLIEVMQRGDKKAATRLGKKLRSVGVDPARRRAEFDRVLAELPANSPVVKFFRDQQALAKQAEAAEASYCPTLKWTPEHEMIRAAQEQRHLQWWKHFP